MTKKRVFGYIFIVTGILLVLSTFSGITGYAVFEGPGKGAASIIGLTLIILGARLVLTSTLQDMIEEAEEEFIKKRQKDRQAGKITPPIIPNRELSELSPQQKSFRRKLKQLLEGQIGVPKEEVKTIDVARLVTRYDHVVNTKERAGPTRQFKVYKGFVNGKEEYFTVDTSDKHVRQVELGGAGYIFPTHIDIQEKDEKNKYKQKDSVKIDWYDLIHGGRVGDILAHYRKRTKNEERKLKQRQKGY